MNTLSLLSTGSKFVSSCLKEWSRFGRANFIQQSKDDVDVCTQNLCDLFIKIISGEGRVDILNKLISELAKVFNDDDFSSKLADILWLLDVAMTDANDAQARDRFFQILSVCKGSTDSALLMERLSDETLEQISLISSHMQTRTRYVRIKTRLFYKQQKFNLLREESEGYAKLIVDLSNTPMGSAEVCITHVRSLIGYFDLDPNRVLDIILDVFEIRRDAFSLFIELLTLYQPDKADLTHILGHKFHFYQEREGTTPESLHRLAALLISYGLVDVDILFAHLQPPDATIHSGRLKSIRDAKSWRPVMHPTGSAIHGSLDNFIATGGLAPTVSGTSTGGSGSLLGDPSRPLGSGNDTDHWNGLNGGGSRRGGGALETSDDSDDKKDAWLPENDVEIEDSAEFQFVNNQKLDLCTALANSGDWKAAQKVIDRFPGHWVGSYAPLNKAICNLVHFLIDQLYESKSTLPPSMLKRRKKPTPPELFLNQEDAKRLTIQQATTFGNLGRYILPIVGYLGPFVSSDVTLIVKLCRVCSVYVSDLMSKKAQPDAVYQAIFNMLDEAILPALNMVSANCCLAEEIWKLIRHLPYEHRYRLYGQWKHMSSQGEPALLRKRTTILIRTKALMKRLSKENVKQLGRHLGKLSHSNPGLLFDFMLHNIQMFTNLITPVVDSLKYVSSLGYDVLAFCLIEALASDKNKTDSLEMGSNLHALATFTGALCKKYQFDLAGILQYVLNQLKAGRSEDLLILQEIIHQMAGLDPYEEMTNEQLEAASGGEILLQEGGYYAQIRNARRNANRLKEALIENKVIMPLVFLMAQQRDAILYLDDPERHVKTAGRLYDQCQGTLVQFITFLSLQLSREEMQAQCFSIDQMMSEYSVPADTAFCLFRNLFLQKVAHLFEASIEKSGDDDKSVPANNKAAYVKAARTVIVDVAHSIEPLYPPRVWEELGTAFFATFWCLESGDLVFPSAAYQRQRHILRSQLDAIEQNSDLNSDKKRREKERCQTLMNRLSKEQDARRVHVDRIRAWLLSERDTWFQTMSATKTDTITQFLQFCVYPRVFYTASDAVYAAQFIHVLHQLKAAQFSTLICLDRIFNDITLPVSICTEKEAHRYGRFLCRVFEFVMRWHSSEEIFNQECGQYPGFVTVFRKGTNANTKADQLQFENYRHVVHKWHYRVTKAAVACLESGNYAQIRNALIVLTRILPHYPKIGQFGSAVERRVNKLKEEEKDRRPDLKVMAFSYAGVLRPLKANWVSEEEFHEVEQKPPTKTQSSSQHIQSSTLSQGSNPALAITEASVIAPPTTTAVVSTSTAPTSTRISPPVDSTRTHTVSSSEGVVKPVVVATTNSKSTRNPSVSSQKRVASNASCEGGNSSSIEHVSGDDLCDTKHRRNPSERSYGVSSSKRPRVSDPQQQQQQMKEDSPTLVSSKEIRRLQRKRAAAAVLLGNPAGNVAPSDVGGRGNKDSVAYLDLDDTHTSSAVPSSKKSRKGGPPRLPLSMEKQRTEEEGVDHRHRRSPASGSHRRHRSTRRASGGGSPSTPPTAAQLRHTRK
ncbi:tho complex subunit 2 [Echinococcus multilocularis]|uniref:THO complex subunit 2 n=1 Tax=Echinococcus multilocularis TaxID=6211 RepID=A0A068YCE9_ECHMU|nr:tho complex subunit 2 [Echinococcus multilocularis]